MTELYPNVEPYEHGMLDVGDGNRVYWEECGNPEGKAAVVLHGGPGSGCSAWHRRLFNPEVYRVVLFDQRGCGRSRPHASDAGADLTGNNTASLIADIERLRDHLGIDRWLVLGGSWGSTLALAYTEAHPDRVTELVLFGVTTGRRNEFDWTFRGGLATFFPEQWERLRAGVPGVDRDNEVVEAYARLLNDSNPTVAHEAAEAWCLWESVTPQWPPTAGLAERFQDPEYALAFARIVTHYVCHNAWLDDGVLLREAGRLADVPGILVNGRFDFQAPVGNAWTLKRVWPGVELVIVDESGHTADAKIARELVRAIERFSEPS
jgi:proline iminopeptidase